MKNNLERNLKSDKFKIYSSGNEVASGRSMIEMLLPN